MRTFFNFAAGMSRDPLMLVAAAALAAGLALVAAWRAAIVGRRTLAAWRARIAEIRSNPAFEHLVGRPVPVGPGADIGDDPFAGGRAALDGGRAHMGQ